MLERAPLVLPTDGRQSQPALEIARGVRRYLRALGFSTLAEVSLANGRRADITAVSSNGQIHIVEIKSCVADFRADQKWHFYRDYCDRLYFAIGPNISPEIMPQDAGLLLADAYQAELLREPPEHRLAPATRRSMLLRFAQTAANRLHDLSDPESRIL